MRNSLIRVTQAFLQQPVVSLTGSDMAIAWETTGRAGMKQESRWSWTLGAGLVLYMPGRDLY